MGERARLWRIARLHIWGREGGRGCCLLLSVCTLLPDRFHENECNTTTHHFPATAAAAALAAAEDELGRPLTAADAAVAEAHLQRLTAAATPAPPAWAEAAARQLPGWVAAGASGDEFAPVAAVTGGVVANDVIRAVSHSDAPTNNVFLYGVAGRSLVHVLPPPGVSSSAAAKAPAAQQAGGGDDAVALLDD